MTDSTRKQIERRWQQLLASISMDLGAPPEKVEIEELPEGASPEITRQTIQRAVAIYNETQIAPGVIRRRKTKN